MKFDPAIHHRRTLRLPEYNYSQPRAYFTTIVTHDREYLFGEITNGEMHLSSAGQIVWNVWSSLPDRYPQIKLGCAVVMPNHFHGIIIINDSDIVGAIHESPLQTSPLPQSPKTNRRRMTLPLVIGYLKMNSAKHINVLHESTGTPVWQRNYFEHIIGSEIEYENIENYIGTNPENWITDDDNLMGRR
jgi:putative transposase